MARDLATVGLGIGIPATLVLGMVLLGLTAFLGRLIVWLTALFVVVAAVAGGSFLYLRGRE